MTEALLMQAKAEAPSKVNARQLSIESRLAWAGGLHGIERRPLTAQPPLVQARPLAGQITPLVQRQTDVEEEDEESIQAKGQDGLIQREEASEEEEEKIQAKGYDGLIQREVAPEEEEEIQTKLAVGPADDEYEREADRVADRVMSMPQPKVQRAGEEEEEELQTKPLAMQITPLVQRQAEPEEEEDERVRSKSSDGLAQRQKEDEKEENIFLQRKYCEVMGQDDALFKGIDRAISSTGRPLENALQTEMGKHFGYDFSNVRMHSGIDAELSAQKINAKAYTVGHDIVFGANRFAPGTYEGRKLIAHELTHVVQQSGNKVGKGNISLPLNRSTFSQQTLQRVISIGGVNLNDARIRSAQNEIVTNYLLDIVNNTSGDLKFTRKYRRNLIWDIVSDIHQASSHSNYGSVKELARDVKQRVLASLYMRMSQEPSGHKGFTYPNSAMHRTAGVGPRVNQAAITPIQYWGPVQYDARGSYFFRLTNAGRADAYRAIAALFTEQTNPHLRTLIHCDYLVSVLQYRAWADSIGASKYKLGVKLGTIREPVLKWNGFAEMDLPSHVPTSIALPPYTKPDIPLKEVTITNESDLIIGDHVVFYNHESYEALIEGTGGFWGLENAIVIDRVGGKNRYQGHGYTSPKFKEELLSGMFKEYNRHIDEAQRFTRAVDRATTPAQRAAAIAALNAPNRYPNVHKISGLWKISGPGFCGTVVTRNLRRLKIGDFPVQNRGLKYPCPPHGIYVMRPVHATP